MTRLSDLKETMLIKDETGLCLGEVWHNERMELLVKDVKSVKFNLELVQWCKDVISDNGVITMHSSNRLTKGQIVKLNSIMKAKTKVTLQKRVYSLSNLFTNSFSQNFFEKDRNKSWVEFCNKHNLDSGLVKMNRCEQTEKIINSMISNL